MRRPPPTKVATGAILALFSLFALTAFQSPSMIYKPLQTGVAACYTKRLVGHRTISGQRYDPNALTAAHGTLPVGTHVRVAKLENGKSTVVVVNDHMSSHGNVIMDISQRACRELQVGPSGEAKVKLEVEPSNKAVDSH